MVTLPEDFKDLDSQAQEAFIPRFEQALREAEGADRLTRLRLHLDFARVLEEVYMPEELTAQLDAALALCPEPTAPERHLLLEAGRWFLKEWSDEEAERLLDVAVSGRPEEPSAAEARRAALTVLGNLHMRRKRFEKAWAVLEMALEDVRGSALPDAAPRASDLEALLGEVASKMGDEARAEHWYRRALADAESAGDAERIITRRRHLARLLPPAPAVALLRQGLYELERAGLSTPEARARAASFWRGLGQALAETGALEEAEAWWRRALAWAEEAAGPDEQAFTVERLARVLSARGRDAEARELRARAPRVPEAEPLEERQVAFFLRPGRSRLEAIRQRRSLSLPETILMWSHGPVTTPALRDERGRPVLGGLLCGSIFGPERDFECACGRYRDFSEPGGSVCEACNVELIPRRTRRSRLGHLQLAAPVLHPFCWRGPRGLMAVVLGISQAELESVASFQAHLRWQGDLRFDVTKTRKETYFESENPSRFHGGPLEDLYGEYFTPSTGPEGLRKGLERMYLWGDAPDAKSVPPERVELIRTFEEVGLKPECMVTDVLPVLPPELAGDARLRFDPERTRQAYQEVLRRNAALVAAQQQGEEEPVRAAHLALQVSVDALFDTFARK